VSRKSSQKRNEANRDSSRVTLSRNPLSPGCFLHVEDETAFKASLDNYIATYQPQHADELDLLVEAVYAKWRQQRIWLAETTQIELAIARTEQELQMAFPRANAGSHLANGFAQSETMIKLYVRYDAQLSRHYQRCLKQLQDLQDRRRPQPDPGPNTPLEPAADAENGPGPADANPARQQRDVHSPSEPNLTPEQAEIRRWEQHRDRLMAQIQARPEPVT
jgi:hypothetical protein